MDLLWKATVSSPIRKSTDDHPTCVTSIIDQTPPEKHKPCTGIHPHGGGVRIPGIKEMINLSCKSLFLSLSNYTKRQKICNVELMIFRQISKTKIRYTHT